MTIENMPAGREMDALVAEKVMEEQRPARTGNEMDALRGSISGIPSESANGSWFLTTTGFEDGDSPIWLPKPYSTDIAAAWEVVEKIRELRHAANESLRTAVDEEGEPSGEIYDHIAFALELWPDCSGWDVNIYDPPAMYATAKADTAPLAICRAALKAMGVL